MPTTVKRDKDGTIVEFEMDVRTQTSAPVFGSATTAQAVTAAGSIYDSLAEIDREARQRLVELQRECEKVRRQAMDGAAKALSSPTMKRDAAIKDAQKIQADALSQLTKDEEISVRDAVAKIRGIFETKRLAVKLVYEAARDAAYDVLREEIAVQEGAMEKARFLAEEKLRDGKREIETWRADAEAKFREKEKKNAAVRLAKEAGLSQGDAAEALAKEAANPPEAFNTPRVKTTKSKETTP